MYSISKKALVFCVLILIICIFKTFPQSAKKRATAEEIPHAYDAYGQIQNDYENWFVTIKKETMKYILIWTLPDTLPFVSLGSGQEAFIERNCSQKNCYVASYRNYFRDMRDFDAILFHGPELAMLSMQLPLIRSPKQIYIFGTKESSHYYPICKRQYNNFFNWTWTYKLDSNLVFSYVIVKNKRGRVLGPNEVMHWKTNEQMLPINSYIKSKLVRKRKAAAWVVSNCYTRSKRKTFVEHLERQMARYGLILDVFGGCGKYQCVRHILPDCWHTIQSDYYFYLVFENSFSKDYVTEKLLKAVQHYAVPIVYGAANYTRFMPKGSYLNALELGPRKLAKEMKDIIINKERYYSFFKWHNHYSYHKPEDDPASDNFCRLCAALHAARRQKKTQNIAFTEWWNDSPVNC